MDVDAVVFDVFGTLTDWRTGVARELATVGARTGLRPSGSGEASGTVGTNGTSGVGVTGGADWYAVTDSWRRRYRPTLGRVVSGELPWQSLDALHRTMLDEVLPGYGLEALGEAERAELVGAWRRLPAWPDAGPGLERLHGTRLVTATLSNGGVGLLARLAKNAGLRFDCVLSAELARSYKPDPRVYRTAAELLGVAPGRLLMVACHPDDLAGAAGSGLRTAFVPRPLEWGPDAEPPAPPTGVDLVASDVLDLARRLADEA